MESGKTLLVLQLKLQVQDFFQPDCFMFKEAEDVPDSLEQPGYFSLHLSSSSGLMKLNTTNQLLSAKRTFLVPGGSLGIFSLHLSSGQGLMKLHTINSFLALSLPCALRKLRGLSWLLGSSSDLYLILALLTLPTKKK